MGSDVVCSTTMGNARASESGMDNRTIPRFLYVSNLYDYKGINDMEALSNAHTRGGGTNLSNTVLTSDVIPEVKVSLVENLQTGESSFSVPKENHEWFVFRTIYNQVFKAQEAFKEAQVQTYIPMHYVQKTKDGKNKRVLEPLLYNIVFAYTTREIANSFVRKPAKTSKYLRFYLDKTATKENNGYHPPLTVGFNDMQNFIRLTSIDNEHIMMVPKQHVHYKNGDMVKVIDGEFAGTIGRVARVAGQQRVVIEIQGLCIVATAYIPTGFIVKF